MRGPRRVAEALLVEQLEALDGARLVVDAGMPVADFLEALRHGGEGEVGGVAVATSSHDSGADTVASGVGRTEYAAATVRSLAFWL